ncbi:hypothetical protein SDRG_05328 [Saprolegnia diclina VS20]|uniref:1-phosphatidylinositol-3-phosphate 5-kinase n=1 Tax=Saprolegnia diclina (strain VS20) TaxID=1156394 RepID=T0QQT0_SAPDV|nr:hypothetical protein SDRG_05328 [Saprolegnia diclina VS20]EQC37101.1 hypothetical protein SDRG_05328 [Saprolegnia diclina VS20]|eukprot:XP_008609263.1 hypothetical protein SDRG_05328 [Saprolegnia diclina VS20]
MLCGIIGHCFAHDLPSPTADVKRALRPGLGTSLSHFDLAGDDASGLTSVSDEKVIVEVRVDTRGGPMDFGVVFRRSPLSVHAAYACQVDSVNPKSSAKEAGVQPGAILTDVALQSMKTVPYDEVLQILLQRSNLQAPGSSLQLVFAQRAKTIHLDRNVDHLTQFPQPTGLALPGTNEFVMDKSEGSVSAASISATPHATDAFTGDALDDTSHAVSMTRFWMSDQHVKACYACDLPFSFCRRKHHCRSCGQIFCYQCCTRLSASFKPPHDAAQYLRKQLVCHPCHRHLRDGADAVVPSVRPALPPPTKPPTAKRPSSTNVGKVSTSPTTAPLAVASRALDSSGRTHDSTAANSLVDDATASLERSKVDLHLFSMFPRVQLVPMAVPAPIVTNVSNESEFVVPLRRRAESEPSLSAIVRKSQPSYLAASSNHAAGQRPRSNSRDDLYTYRQPTNVVRSTRSATELMVEALMLSSGDRSLPSTSLAPPVTTTPALLLHTSSSASLLSLTPSIHLGHACQLDADVPGLLDAVAATKAAMKSDADQWLHERILQLWEASPVLTQLPYLEQSQFVDRIFEFATRAAVTIDVGDSLDILHYLRVKCFPGGHVSDSFFVHGVLCHKAVARKSMRQWIESPRLLLVASSLDYQREKEKLSSLESVAGQETEYMRIAVEKIRTLRPDIVLFQGHVHRVAEELLASSGIVIVKNLKRADLERLSRVTGAALLTSYDHVDKLFGATVLGTCDRFRVWSSEVPKMHVDDVSALPSHLATTHVTTALRGAKHLAPIARKRTKKQCIVFEGGAYAKGCTIALRGAAENVLKEVRLILRNVVRTAYHVRLQTMVLATSGLVPPVDVTADFRHEWFHASSSMYLALNDHSLSMRAALKESQMRCRHCKRLSGRRTNGIATGMDNLVSRRRRSSDSGRLVKKQVLISACRCPSDVHGANRDTLLLSACWSRLDDQSPSPSELVEIAFYTDADCTLGQFLHRYCFESASAPFKTAFRTQRLSFSHDLGRVLITVSPTNTKGKARGPGQELLEMFNFATRVVQSPTPLMWVATEASPSPIYTAVPPEMLHYSFGKYVEDLLYLQPLAHDPRFFPHLPHARDPSLLRYFACADVIVCIAVEPIHPVLHVAMRPGLYDVDDQRSSIDAADIEELVLVANSVLDVTLTKVQATLDDLVAIGEKKHLDSHAWPLERLQEIENMGQIARHWHIMYTTQVRRQPPADVFAKHALFRKAYERAARFCVELRQASNKVTFKQTEVVDDPPPMTLPMQWFDILSAQMQQEQPPASAFGIPLPSPHAFASLHKSPPMDIHRPPIDSAASQRDFVSRLTATESMTANSVSNIYSTYGGAVAFPDESMVDIEGSHDGSTLSSQSLNRTQVVGSNALVKKSSSSGDQSHLFVLPKSILSWHPSLPRGVNQTVVLVNASQPTSAVAYSLCSKEYIQQRNEWFAKQDPPVLLVLDSNVSGMLRALRSDKRSNVDHLFVDENEFQAATRFSCKSYYASQFHALRQLLYKDERKYIESMCQCEHWNASGGKSGAGFMRTKDQRFICKVIPSNQLTMFLNMASSYFEYMATSIEENLPSMLGKIVGVYRITMTETTETALCLLVMENLVYGRTVDHLFDLKGKLEGRFMEHTDHQVLWDRNFVKMTRGIPLPLQESAMGLLKSAIFHDTAFLASQDVTDYSLLVGYDHDKQEIVAGIIDYIAKYDFLKRLEHHGKRLLQDEGEITVLNPKQYTKRFRTAMAKYFTAVPSRYTLATRAESAMDDDTKAAAS